MTSCPLRYHGLDHVVLRVSDITQSLAFYTGVLGMALERIVEDLGIYQVRCGRNLIDLQVQPADTPLAARPARGLDHVCVLVEGPLAPLVDYLRRAGAELTFGPVELYGATGFGTSVYVLDPDGHTIEIKADRADAPLRTTAAAAAATLTRAPVAPRR